MNYEFALDKKATVSLILGSIVIAVLLFFAGWLVGSQWTRSESAATTSAGDDRQGAALPKEPVLNEEESAAPKSNPPKNAKPEEKLTAEAGGTSLEPSPLAASPGANDQVAIISEADPQEDAENNGAAVVEPEYVTVQVGVFLSEKDASSLLKQIESKGYAPSFYTGRDAEARQWYAVRIGVYSDREQAAKAASNFTRQEKIKAVVRPLESL